MQHHFYWLSPALEVRATERCGNGTFAKSKIEKGALLLVIGGYILPLAEEEKLPGRLADNGIQITEDMSICAAEDNQWGGINNFNHSCDPNAGIKGQIFLVALRDIERDEEVRFDYAMTLSASSSASPYRMDCLCGSINCRQVVTDEDWRDPGLQAKYKGYFQYYLQEKINNLSR